MIATVILGFVLLIICTAQGKVLPAGCAAVTCFAGQKCVTFPYPRCVSTCQTMKCPKGETCVQGKVNCAQRHPRHIPLCEHPKERGWCVDYAVRYYFNSKSRQCDAFIYSGCGGNVNNFKTLEDCWRECKQ
ncbi:early lactation protein isoform X1 [Lingula anatina]|uniref:Early lactation protein isoform X1 n=1 Tax=Lingula anatina TaxID=7574 RepID=A0A1S3HGY9_LINAN|nr:early lactation protein isoform X1 [Lingula anatina]|eukprot:XP_013385340.1 early lactation protein isoform X1 [Lingula anatina]